MLLYEIYDVLKKAEIKFAIVGGYALALHGLVRATEIPVASLSELLKMKKESARPQDLIDIDNIKAKINAKK